MYLPRGYPRGTFPDIARLGGYGFLTSEVSGDAMVVCMELCLMRLRDVGYHKGSAYGIGAPQPEL